MKHLQTFESFLDEGIKVELPDEKMTDLNESGIVNTGNAISEELTKFLKETVIPKSKGYVRNERDAAALLLDVLKHRYNLR